jgi:hypothetical protein
VATIKGDLMYNLVELLNKFGFGVVLSLIIVGLFAKVLQWVMNNQREQMKNAIERENKMTSIIEGFQTRIKEHTDHARNFSSEMAQAMQHNRAEHKEMIMILGRINGYKNK